MDDRVEDENRVTLAEAADVLGLAFGTLRSWRSRQLIWPAAHALNPVTNRQVDVYELAELVAVKNRLRPRHARST